jgi:hypothetical protein
MKIVKNEKLIERNGKIANWTTIGALGILAVGMYISLTKPEYFAYSVVCLLAGFLMTQVGMYMSARWGRSPRPDEKLDAGLKGLHSDFNMYHYSAPASHLLVGPLGVWVLSTYHQGGKVEFKKERWRLSGGGIAQAYMRIFGQEGLGRPDLDAEGEAQAMRNFFAKKMNETEIPEVKPILVFLNDQLELDAGDSPIAAMKLKQLKEFLRQTAKNRALSTDKIKTLCGLIEA